jgi:hypothetical protein
LGQSEGARYKDNRDSRVKAFHAGDSG